MSRQRTRPATRPRRWRGRRQLYEGWWSSWLSLFRAAHAPRVIARKACSDSCANHPEKRTRPL